MKKTRRDVGRRRYSFKTTQLSRPAAVAVALMRRRGAICVVLRRKEEEMILAE